AERQGFHETVVATKGIDLLPGCRIPDLHLTPDPTVNHRSSAARCEPLAIAAENDHFHVPRVTFERADDLAGGAVPEPHQVAVCLTQDLAIRAECQFGEVVGMTQQNVDNATGTHLPDPYGLITAARSDLSTVRAERQVCHLSLVTAECANLRTCCGIP